jgi:hypothetical protein
MLGSDACHVSPGRHRRDTGWSAIAETRFSMFSESSVGGEVYILIEESSQEAGQVGRRLRRRK